MKFFYKSSVLLLVVFLAACDSAVDAPSTAPQNVTVTAGENLVVVNWDTEPGLIYWVYYKQGTVVTPDNYDHILYKVTPPYIINNLENGTDYSVIVSASYETSPAGPFSASQMATPRLVSTSTPWSVGTALTTENLNSIAYGNGVYVTVGNAASVFSGTYSYIEADGVSSWNVPSTLPVTTTDLSAVVFSGSLFAALGTDGTSMTSLTGDVWDVKTAIPGVTGMNGLAFAYSTFVAVGNGGVIYTNSSTDLTGAWTLQSSGTANNLLSVTYVNNKFIALGELGTLLTSTDGVTWTAQVSNTNNSLRKVAYGNSLLVAVGDAGTVVSSADGISWTLQTIPTTESFYSITYGPDQQFIAVGTNGLVAYSLTGADASWATTNEGIMDLYSIAPNKVFIAVGAAGSHITGK